MSSGAILVTGGAGYVGAHTCKALRRAGFTPVVLDNLSTGHKSFVRWGPFVPGDIRDTDAVRHTIRAYQVEAVLHFAASAYVGELVTDPQKYYENNVAGSLSLLNAMLEAGCRKRCLLELLRDLWRTGRNSHQRDDAAKSSQPLWRLQGDGRAHAFRLSAGPRDVRHCSSIFQCQRSRSGVRSLASCAIRKPISFRGR